MISPNIILAFDGNHADIPSGFTRETLLDGKFPKATADGVAPSVTGGASTHGHTSPSHSHAMNAHTHSYNTGEGNNSTVDDGRGDSGGGNADEVHDHDGSTSGAVSGGGLSGSATIGSGSNNPSYYDVIFIKSSGYNFIPNSSMVLKSSTTRAGLSFHTGSAGKYLRGAGTGLNAGSTGGSNTHTHTYNHTHSAVSHSHAGANSAQVPSQDRQNYGDTNDYEANSAYHTHIVTLNSTSTPFNSVSASFTSGTVEPAYKTLNAFKNVSGENVLPEVGDIGLWLGSLSAIPVGWALCDGTNSTPDMRDRFLKINTSATTSSTGGSNTHTHTGVASHSHSATGTHSHSGTCPTSLQGAYVGGNGHSKSRKYHTHTIENVSSVTATWANATISTDTPDNQPEYRTVAYIQLQFQSGGGSIIGRML